MYNQVFNNRMNNMVLPNENTIKPDHIDFKIKQIEGV